MASAPLRRRLLPLLTHRRGRSAATCMYRCGNACAHPAPNTSDNEYFGDGVAEAAATQMSRRGVLTASAVGAVAVGVVGTGVAQLAASATAEEGAGPVGAAGGGGDLTFTPIPPNTLDSVVVPNGYDHAVVIRWGEPIMSGAPDYDPHHQSAAAQEKQFGYNNDFVGFFGLGGSNRRALLAVNHEYTNEALMFPGFVDLDSMTREQVRVAMAAHGMSVVEIERVGDTGQWRFAGKRSRYNRRFPASAPFTLDGPAAGTDLVKTSADPAGKTVFGTLNNCSGGVTPWGTALSGEENFNQYFVGGDQAPEAAKAALKRYGIDVENRYPSGSRKWDRADPRFDLAKNPNEANRFGWIVEIDPYDPKSTPVKHTALGRFKHEGANIQLTRDGRAVAYMGDDERFDYLYKFVSDKKVRRGNSSADRAHNKTLLSSGTLYVAKFSFTSADEIDGSGKLPSDGAFDGKGTWIPLVKGDQSMVEGMTAAEVLVFARLAGDKVGATKMDRPEDVQPNHATGKVYAALTNNTDRGASGKPGPDEVNPRNGNKHGQVLELTEDGDDAAAETFSWTLPLVCGDPEDPNTYFAGYDKTKVSPISCPDNVAFDRSGKNLWIATDGNALESNDGLFAMPLEGSERGYLRQFLTVPIGAETCGPVITDDQRSVIIAVQHPGEFDDATFDNPASTWPDGDHARPALVAVWRIVGDRRIGA